MHPGDDPAAAGRFLGWLQGRGEPLDGIDRDVARITELLAWHLGPDEIATLPLAPGEQPRIARRIALWRELRRSLPADWAALGGKDPAQWLSAPTGSPTAPASPPPRLVRPARAMARRWLLPFLRGLAAAAITGIAIAACAALVAGMFALRSEREAAPMRRPPLLARDASLKRAMAETIACRREAAARMLAAGAMQLEALAGPECERKPVACLERGEVVAASLTAAREHERATAELARRTAPLPPARCPGVVRP